MDLLTDQGTLKSLLQHHSSKASSSLTLSFLYRPTLTSYMITEPTHRFDIITIFQVRKWRQREIKCLSETVQYLVALKVIIISVPIGSFITSQISSRLKFCLPASYSLIMNLGNYCSQKLITLISRREIKEFPNI